jgi:hypothetical protein
MMPERSSIAAGENLSKLARGELQRRSAAVPPVTRVDRDESLPASGHWRTDVERPPNGAQRSRQFLRGRRTVRTMTGTLVDTPEPAGISVLDFSRIRPEIFTPWRKRHA